jgi:acyl-coenzyme A thioesterase PaaI-like protein
VDSVWVPHTPDSFVGSTLQEVLKRRRGKLVKIGLRAGDNHKNLSGVIHGGVDMALFDPTIGINGREAFPGERMATASNRRFHRSHRATLFVLFAQVESSTPNGHERILGVHFYQSG